MELDYKVVLFCTQEDVDTLSQQYNVRSISRLNNEDDSDKNESESDEEVEDNGESETNEAMEEEEQNSGDEEEQEVFPYQHRANVAGYQRCDKCFSQPCITNEELNHQKWWIDTPEEKSEVNSGKRKWKYRQFYSNMRSMGLWKKEEYLLKKTRIMALDGITPGKTNREIMPDCVTAFVRAWLPNPDGKPYMGHTWINPNAVVT